MVSFRPVADIRFGGTVGMKRSLNVGVDSRAAALSREAYFHLQR